MRKPLGVSVLVGLALAACSTSSTAPIQRYYDPNGLFSARLPAPNDVLVVPPQQVHGSPELLSAVLSLPPQPSPQASNAPFGGGNFQQNSVNQDTAIYGVFVVKADKFKDTTALARALLSGTLGPTVVSQTSVNAGDLQGILAVVDHNDDQGGGTQYTDASAFFLDGEVGYWIREMFAPGQWDSRKDSFLNIVHSFEPRVPPGVTAVPITREGLQVRDPGIAWPLG